MQIVDSELIEAVALFVGLYSVGWFLVRATARSPLVARSEVRILFVAMAVRFAASLLIYRGGLVEVFRDEDATGWLGGVALYQEWTSRALSLADLPGEFLYALAHPLGNYGYYYVVGALFLVLDAPNRLPVAVLNDFFGAVTVILSYRTAALLFSEWVAIRVAWAFCFFPSLVVWSAQTLKEPIVIFLETLALYCCMRIKTSRNWALPLVVCAVATFLLAAFRFYAAYLVGAAVILSLSLPRLSRGRSTVAAAGIVSAALAILVVSSGVLASHETVFNEYSLAKIQEMRDYTARTTGSGVVLQYSLLTTPGFLLSSLVGWIHLLLAPFPWQLGAASLRMLLTIPDAALWWMLFFFGVVRGMPIMLRARFAESQPFLFFALGLGTLYSITFSNVGLIYRYRAQLMPLLLILAMVGLEQRALHAAAARRTRRPVWRTERRPAAAGGDL